MRDVNRRTPLHLAAREGHTDIVKFLIAKNANLKALDNRNRYPVDEAELKGHNDIHDLLDNIITD